MCNIIEISDLDKSYGQLQVLKKIKFVVKKGDIIIIKGKSGSGKTTLLNILGFIDDYEKGEYFFDSHKYNYKDFPKIRNENIGFVFQNYNLINGLTSLENIKIPYIYCKNVIAEEYNNNLDFLISFLQIENLLEKNVIDLSGGEKQRVALCRALSLKPKVILADEPTGNLDPSNKKIITDIFQKLNEIYGITIIIVTHDNIFDDMATKKYIIKDGKIYEDV